MLPPTRPSTATSPNVARARALEARRSRVLPLGSLTSTPRATPVGAHHPLLDPVATSPSEFSKASRLAAARRSQWVAAAEADREVYRILQLREAERRAAEREQRRLELDEQIAARVAAREAETAAERTVVHASLRRDREQVEVARSQRRSATAERKLKETTSFAENLAAVETRRRDAHLAKASERRETNETVAAAYAQDYAQEAARRRQREALASEAAAELSRRKQRQREEEKKSAALDDARLREATERDAVERERRRDEIEQRKAVVAARERLSQMTADAERRAAAAAQLREEAYRSRAEANEAENVEAKRRAKLAKVAATRSALDAQISARRERTASERARARAVDSKRCTDDSRAARDYASKDAVRFHDQQRAYRLALEAQLREQVLRRIGEAEAA
jgi:hypothetical protein